jgi:hypothetical protein
MQESTPISQSLETSRRSFSTSPSKSSFLLASIETDSLILFMKCQKPFCLSDLTFHRYWGKHDFEIGMFMNL